MGPFARSVTTAVNKQRHDDAWAFYYYTGCQGGGHVVPAHFDTMVHSREATAPELRELTHCITEQQLIADGITRIQIERRRTRRGLGVFYLDSVFF